MVSDPPGLIFYHCCLPRHSMEPQDVEKKEFLQDTVDECVLAPSTKQERRDSGQSYRDGKFLFDEPEFGSTLDMAYECSHSKGAITPRGPPGGVHIPCSSHPARLIHLSSPGPRGHCQTS